MSTASLESVHDLIFITDFHSPAKKTYSTITSVLNSLNIFWFQGPRDGRIYVTRDALMWRSGAMLMCSDYLTKIEENKRIWSRHKLVMTREQLIPFLLVLV